ncbi:MAG: signal transduction histidine kinase, nitrogen specific, NtrB [Firmicutes bacterium]|nr:signal transduction histidine kinase, nitrogen specific, NtrB [Bacillota bacterium]
MDYVYVSIIGTITGTLSMILVYLYLYSMYRERYIGIWAIAWSIFLLRNIFFDSGMFKNLFGWNQSLLSFTVYQLFFITSSLVFVWGTYIFIGRAFNKAWLYGAISASLLSAILFLQPLPLLYKILPPAWFGGIVLAWISMAFFRHSEAVGIGKSITGTAFLLWSILTIIMPFFIESFPLLITFTGSMLRLIITVSTVMIFLERSRINLIKKEAHYRLLLENAIDIIFYYRFVPKPKIEYISPSVYPITGYTSEQYYKDETLIFNVIHPDDHHIFNDFIHSSCKLNDSPLILRLVRKDKTILWIEQKCVPIYDKTGNLIALEGIIRDITDRKSLEKVASRFDRMNMVGNMAVTVAHEIRNPMTTIRGYLQFLERKKEYQVDKSRFKLMIDEIDRANDIIREYLALSKEKLADLKLSSLNNFIESLFPLIEADATASKIYVSLELTTIPEIFLDENEIRQMLLNLVRNSIEAMPEGGKLIIKTHQNTDDVILSIIDDGFGIPEHILDKLGTPFITTKTTGTGLGLPICYQIAHRHNAHIEINSNRKGTNISIYFSLANSIE